MPRILSRPPKHPFPSRTLLRSKGSNQMFSRRASPVLSQTTSHVEGLSYRVRHSDERSHAVSGSDSSLSPTALSSSSSLVSLAKGPLEEPPSSNWGHFVDFYSSETDNEAPPFWR